MKYSPTLSLFFLIAYCIASEHRTAISKKSQFQNNRPLIAIAAQNFTDLVLNSNIFVDKTLLIQMIVEDDNEIILLTRPRYWGKTLNLHMVKTFLEITTDSEGTPIYNSTPNYRLFMDTDLGSEKLKKPLIIARQTHFVEKYLGKHPVIFIDFSHIKQNNFLDFMDEIATRISDTFRRHQYIIQIYHRILNDTNAKTFDKKMARKRLDQFAQILHNEQNLNIQDLTESLKFLSEILHAHFHSSVFIMIDEYDAPLNIIFTEPHFPKEDAEQIFQFYTTFLVTTLKKNIYLEKAILTGRFPLSKEVIKTGLKGIAEYTFFNSELMEYYGFKRKEVQAMSKCMKTPTNITHLADSFFGGYEFRHKEQFIYNPQFIVNYLATNNMSLDPWLDINPLKNFLKFFMKSEVVHFERYWNAFQPAGDGYPGSGGHPVRVSYLNDGHFTQNELSLLYQALRCDYNATQFNETLYKFDLPKFADKTFLFLYNMGYFSLMDSDRFIAYMEYPLKNRNMCEEFFEVLDEGGKWEWDEISEWTTPTA